MIVIKVPPTILRVKLISFITQQPAAIRVSGSDVIRGLRLPSDAPPLPLTQAGDHKLDPPGSDI